MHTQQTSTYILKKKELTFVWSSQLFTATVLEGLAESLAKSFIVISSYNTRGSASSMLASTAVTAVISVVSGKSTHAFAVELKISRTKTMVSFQLHSLT